MPTQRTVLRDLSTLCEAARELTVTAHQRTLRATAEQTDHIAHYLDATRTVLVQEGASYLDVALAIRDTCADRLAAHAVWIGKCADRDPCAVIGCVRPKSHGPVCDIHHARITDEIEADHAHA